MKKPSKKYVGSIIAALEKQYPDALCSLTYNKPHELMIAGRLSAQCTDARVNLVTPALFEKYRSIDDFAEADLTELQEIIKPCGLYKTKAQSIKNMCIRLRDVYGGVIPDTIEDLTTLPGIGRKTANLVMGDVHGKPAYVTDTHCIRICRRLRLTDSDVPVKVEEQLRKIIPPEKSSDFCHRLVLFGREFCKAPKPKCEGCPLAGACPCTASPTPRK